MIKFTLKYSELKGLRTAPLILGRNLKGSLTGIGKRLIKSAQIRMREDTRASKRSLRMAITGKGGNYQLDVFSTLMQAFIDAYGLPKGTFPPFGPGTKLYQWAARKMRSGRLKPRVVGTSYSKTNRKGIHRPRRTKRLFKVNPARKVDAVGRRKARQVDVKRFAYLAARAIYKNGIVPSHWNIKALEVNKSRILTDLQNGLQRTVNEINRTK